MININLHAYDVTPKFANPARLEQSENSTATSHRLAAYGVLKFLQ